MTKTQQKQFNRLKEKELNRLEREINNFIFTLPEGAYPDEIKLYGSVSGSESVEIPLSWPKRALTLTRKTPCKTCEGKGYLLEMTWFTKALTLRRTVQYSTGLTMELCGDGEISKRIECLECNGGGRVVNPEKMTGLFISDDVSQRNERFDRQRPDVIQNTWNPSPGTAEEACERFQQDKSNLLRYPGWVIDDPKVTGLRKWKSKREFKRYFKATAHMPKETTQDIIDACPCLVDYKPSTWKRIKEWGRRIVRRKK
jgi:hypothetical protein